MAKKKMAKTAKKKAITGRVASKALGASKGRSAAPDKKMASSHRGKNRSTKPAARRSTVATKTKRVISEVLTGAAVGAVQGAAAALLPELNVAAGKDRNGS